MSVCLNVSVLALIFR